LLVFSSVEIWASLLERSTNLHPTPADNAVLDALGLHGAPVSPTIIMVAVLLPFASIYYGFSQQGRAKVNEADLGEQEQVEAARLKRKLMRAQVNAEIRQAQAQGLAGMMKAGVQTLRNDDHDDAVVSANGHHDANFSSPSRTLTRERIFLLSARSA
jgi:hypothetical protein